MKVFQIYFDENQLDKIEYTPYYNKECSVFFESSVIRKLIESGQHLNTNYFGVVSYQLRNKLGFTKEWSNRNIANNSLSEFTPDKFEIELLKHSPDVMGFQRHPSHDPILLADRYHPDFSRYFHDILRKIGYAWKPTVLENVFYCNYFVARPEIYERYVKEMLAPAMDIMENMPELLGDSKYPKALPDNLKKSFGINHYPYHPFLVERMFSYYAHIHNLKCLHY